MKRAFVAVSMLALASGATAPASAYHGDDAMGPPSANGPYPPAYDNRYPQGYPPPGYGTYGDPYGRRAGEYPQPYPRAARPSGPNYMPQASAPDTAGSVESARRLYTVADTVALRGASLCGSRVKSHTGMRAWSRDSMGPQAPQASASVDHTVTVFTVAKDGPAARAGLKPGDKITSVNGESIPSMAGAMSIYQGKIETALAQRGPVAIGYTRNGERSVARVTPAPACDYRVVFSNAPMINALTDGNSVTVMRGLVNLLSRDDELALVIGHEIGHNVLGHFARGRELGHQAGPFNSGAQASMRQFEKEADYIGLYFVALAGYDMDTALQSSQRMAAASPMGDRGSPTHPSQAERQAVLQAALKEIRAKLAQGQALKPSLGSLALSGARQQRENTSRLPIQ
jgi:beta-barrel assembly-enhancing protease